MCILCVASRWSRRIVAMLPWLVFPLTIVWALSQLLPPGFQFEITSPRLACVAVLFMSLIWYEVVMPKLYAWRDRRRDVLRERRRIEAQEAAKWRKEATRRCRNCFTAYKDQTPAGGRFMCMFCGHVSKRPVLDVPEGASSAGSPFSLSGVATGFITGGGLLSSRSSKMWNARAAQERPMGGRGWMGGRSWTDGGSLGVNGSWSWPGSALYFGSAESVWAGLGNFAGGEVFGGERCSARESYFGFFWLVLRVISHFLYFVGWIWRKLYRVGFSGEDCMGRSHRSRHSAGEDAGPSPETRGEKARRKAEEKRIARLEKEQLEAEERKQREEVARLVEERRRQRDEKLEAEKESEREATVEKEREIKRDKEAEKRRQEKSREKVQSKERAKEQETEDLKKKKGKDIEKKADTDKSKGEDLKTSSINASESDKISKGIKLDTTPKGNEGGTKIPSLSKWGSSKDIGSARTGFFSKSKNVAASINSATSFWGRSLSAGSKQIGQSSKAVIPSASSVPSTSNPSTASNGKPTKVSGSAWNRIHWANVWGKAGNKVPCDAPRKSEVAESTDKILESSTDSVKCVVDGDIVSPSAVGVLRQPIAPPSSLPDSRDNLFSGPIGFPPVQLPLDSAFQELRQVQAGNRIHQVPYAPDSTSLLSTQSYFGSSSSVACAGTQVLRGCTCSDDINLATPASLPLSVSSSLNMIDLTEAEFDPSLMCSSVNDRGTSSSPLSSLNTSSSTASTVLEGLEFRNAKQEEPYQILEPWNMPPGSIFSGTATRDSPPEGLWHHWSAPPQPRNFFSQPSLWNVPCQLGIDPLQLFHATLEPTLEPEPHLPSRIFSMECKDEISGRPCGEYSCSLPVLGSNFWLDSPGVKSIMHVWEDANMNQGVPPEFVDCITHSLMQDPVITADGHSYERSAIEAWLKLHDTSPKTGEVLPPPPGGNGVGVDKTLRPNHILRGQIIEYAECVARGFGPHEMLVSPVQNMTAGGSAWSERNSAAPMRGFYPSPGVKSFWSYNSSGG